MNVNWFHVIGMSSKRLFLYLLFSVLKTVIENIWHSMYVLKLRWYELVADLMKCILFALESNVKA